MGYSPFATEGCNMDWSLHQLASSFLLATLFLETLHFHAVEPENTQLDPDVLQPLPMTTLETTSLPTVDSPLEGDFSPGEETPLKALEELEEFNLCIQSFKQGETWDTQRVPSPEVQVKNLSLQSSTSMPPPHCMENYIRMKEELPKISVLPCILRQSRKAARIAMDLPPNVHAHLSGGHWLGEAFQLSSLSNRLPPSCEEALCHPAVNVSFRVVDGVSEESVAVPAAFMAMYGQAAPLLDRCREHVQALSNITVVTDLQENTLLQIAEHYWLILFQNQRCHHTDSLTKISILTNMQVLYDPPPPCLQSILCSPSTLLQYAKRSPSHFIWIPFTQGHLPLADLMECFQTFSEKQDQEPSIMDFTVSSGRVRHELVLFGNPHCHVHRPERLPLLAVLESGNIPPSSCLSLLCAPQSRVGIHVTETVYIMTFSNDSSLMSQCRFQLSMDSRSNRTNAIEGLTFPLRQSTTFFLPDSDCYASLSPIYSPLILSIIDRNVSIPKPCVSQLCSQHITFFEIKKKYFYIYSKSDKMASACFEALAPNPKSGDTVRALPISGTINTFQISPACISAFKEDLFAMNLFVLLMDSGVSLPLSCYSQICQGFVGYIENVDDKTEMYYALQPEYSQTGCYSALLNSALDTRKVNDSNNCSFTLLRFPNTNEKITMVAVSNPKCQYTYSEDYVFSCVQHVDMFFSLNYGHPTAIKNEFFSCIAKKMDKLYVYMKGLYPQFVRMYGIGVRKHFPEICVRLACDPWTIISYQSEINVSPNFSVTKNAYITFQSTNGEDVGRIEACSKALTSTGKFILKSKGILIPSYIHLRGSLAPPEYLFLVFPPAQCTTVQNALKASVITYFLIFYEEISQECVERILCNSNISMGIVNFRGKPSIYYSYRATSLHDSCTEDFKGVADFTFHDNDGVDLAYHKVRRGNPYFTHIIFDFSLGVVRWEIKQLITDLFLKNHDIGQVASCMLCSAQSLVVVRQELQEQNGYLMVPHVGADHYCDICYQQGDPIANFPDLVSFLSNDGLHLFMLPRNTTYLTTDSFNMYETSQRYLYFVDHRFDVCARLDQGNFQTFLHSHDGNITRFYLIQREDGFSCINQVMKSSSFSCSQGEPYVLCLEKKTINCILYLRNCSFLSSAKFEILSTLIFSSLEVPSNVDMRVMDLCAQETHVSLYVEPSDKLFYEIVGQTSNLSRALDSLTPRLRIMPSDMCMLLLHSNFLACATAHSITKIDELLQSQTGVITQNYKYYSVTYQCMIYAHPDATLRLYRPISVNNLMIMSKDFVCKESFETHEQKFFGILQNNILSIEPEIVRNSSQVSSTIFEAVHTSSCPNLKDDNIVDFVTASVVQNNSACLQDLCTGNFVVSNETEGEVSLIGPLFISMYRSPCFKAIPPQVWRKVNRAFVSGRATLNKFWPGCFYDYIVISTSKDAKINDWTYLPVLCKIREITYFTGSLILTIITIVGNLVVIYTLFYHAKMSDASCRLRVNLAFADLLVGLFVQSRALHNHLSLMTGALTLHQLDELSIYDNFEEDLETSAFGFSQIRFIRTGFDAFCGFVFSVSSFVSLTFMSLMTLERYLMVAHQRHHGRVFKNPALTWIILGTWIGGFVFAILLLQKEDGHEFVGYFDPISKLTTSLPSSSIRSASFLAFYTTVFFFTITSLLVGVLSVLTFWRFSTSHERLRRRRIYAQDPLKPILIQKLRVILTVFVTAYIISCVPLVMGSALNVFLLSPACHQIMWWIYLSSSAWNCYLYNFRLSKFRADILTSLHCVTTTRIGRWLEDIADDARGHLESSKNKRISASNKAFNRVSGIPQQVTSSF